MSDYITQDRCKCCGGTGVQYNQKTGLRQPCPYCNNGRVKRRTLR